MFVLPKRCPLPSIVAKLFSFARKREHLRDKCFEIKTRLLLVWSICPYGNSDWDMSRRKHNYSLEDVILGACFTPIFSLHVFLPVKFKLYMKLIIYQKACQNTTNFVQIANLRFHTTAQF